MAKYVRVVSVYYSRFEKSVWQRARHELSPPTRFILIFLFFLFFFFFTVKIKTRAYYVRPPNYTDRACGGCLIPKTKSVYTVIDMNELSVVAHADETRKIHSGTSSDVVMNGPIITKKKKKRLIDSKNPICNILSDYRFYVPGGAYEVRQ